MPLVRISLASTRSPEQRRAIADGVHDALVKAVGIPAADRFQVLDVHAPDELVFDREYLDVARRDVVYVHITFVRGRSREIKLDLFRRIAANLAAADVRAEDVFVTLTENSIEDWSVGNGVAQLVALGSVPGVAEEGTAPVAKTDISFGPAARNRLAQATDPSPAGALAALETFYYALNNQDLDALSATWASSPLAQLNNPLGGILRGGDAITALYGEVFSGTAKIQVTFSDVVAYQGPDHAVFAGRETGTYNTPDGTPAPLNIRTSRYFRYEDGRWRQFHHHGSIDDADALADYQKAVRGA
jgi:ketosteroid isomerase-like protein/phenylpyruvate tautomerase PptA (4-oxalocrotonate tautomerase family)